MRVFYAIEFEDEIKNFLSQVQESVKNSSRSGNFTRRENFHLTLRFIGDVEAKNLAVLKKAADNASGYLKCFNAQFGGLGKFDRGNKSIVWLGIKKDHRLEHIYKSLESALLEAGYPGEDKEYVPHITLGREVVLNQDFNKIKQETKIGDMSFPVCKISLMESARINGVLTYTPVYSRQYGE